MLLGKEQRISYISHRNFWKYWFHNLNFSTNPYNEKKKSPLALWTVRRFCLPNFFNEINSQNILMQILFIMYYWVKKIFLSFLAVINFGFVCVLLFSCMTRCTFPILRYVCIRNWLLKIITPRGSCFQECGGILKAVDIPQGAIYKLRKRFHSR